MKAALFSFVFGEAGEPTFERKRDLLTKPETPSNATRDWSVLVLKQSCLFSYNRDFWLVSVMHVFGWYAYPFDFFGSNKIHENIHWRKKSVFITKFTFSQNMTRSICTYKWTF